MILKKYSELLFYVFFCSTIVAHNREQQTLSYQKNIVNQAIVIASPTKTDFPIEHADKFKVFFGLNKTEKFTPLAILSVRKNASQEELFKAYVYLTYKYSLDYLFAAQHRLNGEGSDSLTKIVAWAYTELTEKPTLCSNEDILKFLGKPSKPYLFNEQEVRLQLNGKSRHLNPYEILKVRPGDSLENITRAYVIQIDKYIYQQATTLELVQWLDINSLLTWAFEELGGTSKQFFTKKDIYSYLHKVAPNQPCPSNLYANEIKKLLSIEQHQELSPMRVLNVNSNTDKYEIKNRYTTLLYQFFINEQTKISDHENKEKLKNVLAWAYESLVINPERISSENILQSQLKEEGYLLLDIQVKQALKLFNTINPSYSEILDLNPQPVYSKKQILYAYKKQIEKFTREKLRNNGSIQLQKKVLDILTVAYNELIKNARGDIELENSLQNLMEDNITKYALTKKIQKEARSRVRRAKEVRAV